MAIRTDLVAKRRELAEPVADGGEVCIKQLDQAWKHFVIGVMATVERFELLHLGEGQTEDLQLLDELQSADIVVGVDALPAIEPLHRFEETALLVIPDGPLGQPDLRGQLPDTERRRRRRSHSRQFTSTGNSIGAGRAQPSRFRRRAAMSSSAFRSAAAP